MIPFEYTRAGSAHDAIHAIGNRGSKFLGGGTNLIDLMKLNVEKPSTLIDVTRIDLNKIETSETGGLRIGALVRNSDLANHPRVVAEYPLLSQALLSGASPQLRNMATTGGNLLQRTRCYYFTDTAFPACNKRVPGSGCAAIIATNPSDMNVALAALGAIVHVESIKGKRAIPLADFHRLPGTTPNFDTSLRPDELITAVELKPSACAKNSWYLKVRDRQSYAFALVSVAAGLEMDGERIKSACLALGGVAHRPWRSLEAENALSGASASTEAFQHAAELALNGAKGYEHNAFKIELAKRSIVRALTVATRGTSAGVDA
jgi:xanthine dehydrogenase YagS FAD-binding subunit